MNRPQHYQNYSRRAEEVEDIFSQFREMMPRGTLARIAHDRADFPQQTISDWYRHWLINREWRPGRAGQSQNHRTFTDEQENGIMATIDAEFLSKHRRFSSRAFKGLVVQVWGRQSPRDCRTDTFSASSSFRLRYLTRHGLSLRTATPKKNEPNRDAAIIKEFLERLRAAREHYGNDHVVNMDETAWKDVQMAGKTIAPKGVKSVPIDVHGDPKAGMSVACTISADARKFPPIYILRADSEQCLNSLLPAVSIDRVTFTHNGWMNTEVMLKYLSWLHFAMNEEPCALVMDSFPGHVTEAVYAKADILAIEIIPVPKGLTGEYQPLDRGGFGPLKKMSQVLWDVRAAREPHLQWNHREAAKLLEVAWAQLPLRVLRSAWRFQDYEEGLSRAQCKQELSRQGLHMVDWGWDDEEEDEQEEESGTDDPAYGRREYIRDTADLSETDQSEPGSTDTENGQYRRLDLVQKRSSARRNVDLRVLPVEVDFHHLDTYPPKWQAQSQMTIGQVHSQKVPTQPSFSEGFRFGPHGRQFNVPEDPLPGGWACPPSVYHPR
jgi:hypothetical protein